MKTVQDGMEGQSGRVTRFDALLHSVTSTGNIRDVGRLKDVTVGVVYRFTKEDNWTSYMSQELLSKGVNPECHDLRSMADTMLRMRKLGDPAGDYLPEGDYRDLTVVGIFSVIGGKDFNWKRITPPSSGHRLDGIDDTALLELQLADSSKVTLQMDNGWRAQSIVSTVDCGVEDDGQVIRPSLRLDDLPKDSVGEHELPLHDRNSEYDLDRLLRVLITDPDDLGHLVH